MGSRLLWRRSATAAGTYASFGLGVLGSIIAARRLGPDEFGQFAVVLSAALFMQTLLDLTVEEAVIKYGFRYQARGDWGRFHRLLRRALALKGIGALLAALVMLVLAPFADSLFGTTGLAVPFALAALIPLAQAPEGMAAATLNLRGRYDVRSGFLTFSMAVRLVAYFVGSSHGVTATVVALVVAQVISTCAIGIAGLAAYERFPKATPVPLGDDRRDIINFVAQSSLATGVVSFRPTATPLLLGLVSTPVEVGYFRVAQAPQQALAALSAPARMVLLTEQTRDWEEGLHAKVLRDVRRYTWAAAVAVLIGVPPLVVFMPQLVRLVYGAGFDGAADAARIILCAAALQFVFGWTKSLPVTIGRPSLRIWTHGLETLVVIPLVLLLGASYGATGAAGAVLASTVAFVLLWVVLFAQIRRDEAHHEPPPLQTEAVGG